jgi:hypothetical protein
MSANRSNRCLTWNHVSQEIIFLNHNSFPNSMNDNHYIFNLSYGSKHCLRRYITPYPRYLMDP